MNELKKHLNENVFRHNPFNDQMKERMVKHVLNKSVPSSRKKKGPLIAMVSAACLIVFFAVAALQAPGIFNFGASGSGLEQLLSKYPDMHKEADKIPANFKDKVQLPTKIPFDVKRVTLEVERKRKLLSNTLPPEAHFVYYSDKAKNYHSLMVDLTFANYNAVSFDSDNPTIKLENGEHAYWGTNKHSAHISWYDKKSGILYSLLLMSSPDNSNHFTKEDLLKMANSMK